MTMTGAQARLMVFVTVYIVFGVAMHPVAAQQGAPNGEWPTYAGDLSGTKYSALDQIDATNFDDLEIAWRWKSADGDLDLSGGAIGTPMTYMHDGMQFIALTVGGEVPELIALALPK